MSIPQVVSPELWIVSGPAYSRRGGHITIHEVVSAPRHLAAGVALAINNCFQWDASPTIEAFSLEEEQNDATRLGLD